MIGDASGEFACILLDTCCRLNLYETGLIAEMLHALPERCAVVDYVVAESLYIRRSGATGDEDDTEPVVLQPLIDRGLLEVLRLVTDDEAVSFVSLTAELEDGEVMTSTIAVHRNAVIATDDRKARRICSSLIPPLPVQTIAAIIQAWADVRQIPDEVLRQILSDVRERARFVPDRHDPLHAWWHSMLDR